MSQATAAMKERPKQLPMTGAQYLEGLRDDGRVPRIVHTYLGPVASR